MTEHAHRCFTAVFDDLNTVDQQKPVFHALNATSRNQALPLVQSESQSYTKIESQLLRPRGVK